jgi:hypothetical protein
MEQAELELLPRPPGRYMLVADGPDKIEAAPDRRAEAMRVVARNRQAAASFWAIGRRGGRSVRELRRSGGFW